MSKRTPLLALVLLSALVSVAWIAAPAQQEAIAGTWIVTSEDNSHQRGLFLFTADGSYSAMFVHRLMEGLRLVQPFPGCLDCSVREHYFFACIVFMNFRFFLSL